MDPAGAPPGLAMDAGGRDDPVVSHDAAVPAELPGRLGRSDGASGAVPDRTIVGEAQNMTARKSLWTTEHETNLLAWRSEIARSVSTPWLAQPLAVCAPDLLPRVAACHTLLRALPRSTRRAWQRRLARS